MKESTSNIVYLYKEIVNDSIIKNNPEIIAYISTLIKSSPNTLKYLIEEYRDKKEKSKLHTHLGEYAGLAQSILYTLIRDIALSWEKAYIEIGGVFDLPYGGAYLTANNPDELIRSRFVGKYSGYKAKFVSTETVSEAKFSGMYSGYMAEFRGYRSGSYAIFNGKYAGYKAIFGGDYSGLRAIFFGENSGSYAKFSGRYSGEGALFIGENSGEYTEFSGYKAGHHSIFLKDIHNCFKHTLSDTIRKIKDISTSSP